jgi:hypothetical protein
MKKEECPVAQFYRTRACTPPFFFQVSLKVHILLQHRKKPEDSKAIAVAAYAERPQAAQR